MEYPDQKTHVAFCPAPAVFRSVKRYLRNDKKVFAVLYLPRIKRIDFLGEPVFLVGNKKSNGLVDSRPDINPDHKLTRVISARTQHNTTNKRI